VSQWAIAAAIYGLVLAVAAVTHPIRRRSIAFAAALAYSLVALGAGTLISAFWVQLLVPGGLLLLGYWLSGLFFRDSQPWLERWLLSIDRAIGADRWMRTLPAPIGTLLEACYTSVHLIVGGAAIYMATFGSERVGKYWALVLAAALASYAPLPWLRSRPPRVADRRGNTPGSAEPDVVRRLNVSILDVASIQANTLPSGHVSSAVAAAFAVMAEDPVTGGGLMVMAGLIAVAAVAGRYHYAVDCVAGAAVASALWSLM
jgi:hypothetical protein